MNGFQLHNIQHTSPSSINMWISSKEKWIRQKLFKEAFLSNPAMERGKAVERAVMDILCGTPEAKALERTTQTFNRALIFSSAPSIDAERLNIAPMTHHAVTALEQYGRPDVLDDGKQHKILATCVTPSWSLPVIGYLDVVYHKHLLIFDLKSTNKLPEKMPADHRRQGSVYQHSNPEYDVSFLYVSAEGSVCYPVEDVPVEMAKIKETLIEQEKFLMLSNSKDILLASVTKEKELVQ